MAFDNAGKQPGLQVWRVEKMDLKLVPPAFHGQFFTGDSYLLLNTISVSPPEYSVHTWIGNDASPDEKGAAPIFMMQLDHFLDDAARQFSEFQEQESLIFKNYFPCGIIYKTGGVATGFKHVENKIIRRLLHVKGRRHITAKEVDLSWKSFNKGDCFIIDLGKNIYQWSGCKSNMYERLKSMKMATSIRDNERQSRAKAHILEEGSEPEEVLKVLGPKPDLPEATHDDLTADKKNMGTASLYVISDATGSMKTTLVAEKSPFKQEDLSQEECYILDDGLNNQIYLWKGKDANTEERKAALSAAQKFIQVKNYSEKCQIQILPAGCETTFFKQFFKDWMDKDEITGGPSKTYTIGSIAKVEKIPFDASTLHENDIMAAQYGMVDDCSGNVKIWRVEKNSKVPVDPSTYGQFFGGDCYLVLYSYNTGGSTKHIIYIWQGLQCSQDELGTSAFLAVELDDSMGGVATQVRVTQGKEPPHLVSLFKDKPLIIHRGGTSRTGGESKPASIRLYQVRQSSTKATRAVEVEPVAPSLNTNDVFVLKTTENLFLWKGKGAAPTELPTAQYVAGLLGGSITEVEETLEPNKFWEALGGKKEYQTSSSLQKNLKPPRLFGCSNKTGNLIAEEVLGELTQIDLAVDDVMLLDAWNQIFIWIGKEANEIEIKGAEGIANDYLSSDPSGRSGIPITIIKQGEEPPSFTGWFQAWDNEFWCKDILERIHEIIGKS